MPMAHLLEELVGPRQARAVQRGSVLIDTESALSAVASILSSSLAAQIRCPEEQPRVVDVLQAALDAAHASGVSDRTIAIPSTVSDETLRPALGRVVSGPGRQEAAEAGSTDWIRPTSHLCLGGTMRKYEDEVEGSFVAMAAWISEDCHQQPSGSYKLLLLAHGYRDPGEPHTSELDMHDPFVNQLVQHGWVVASTSYRRQGRIVVEACQDVNELRAWVTRRFGPPGLCILEGRSMGGAVGTLLAEGQHGGAGLYNGVVCIGAALMHEVTTDGTPVEFTHTPLVPLLYLTNQSELGAIEKYRAGVRRAAGEFEPAIWTVWREGHNLVSVDERLAAVSGLMYWIEYGTFITQRDQNIFLPYEARVGKDEQFTLPTLGLSELVSKKELRAPVIAAKACGSIWLDVQEDKLYQIGVRCDSNRSATVRHCRATADMAVHLCAAAWQHCVQHWRYASTTVLCNTGAMHVRQCYVFVTGRTGSSSYRTAASPSQCGTSSTLSWCRLERGWASSTPTDTLWSRSAGSSSRRRSASLTQPRRSSGS